MDDRVNERDGHMWRTGPYCKGKFGKERHDRRSTYSIWASSRSGRNCNSSWILEICHCTTESQKLGGAHRRAEKDKAITGDRDFRREAIKIRVRVRRDVEEGLGAIEPQTTSRPLLLNDRKGPLKVQSRATQGLVIQIPVIQQESRHLRLYPLNNRL